MAISIKQFSLQRTIRLKNTQLKNRLKELEDTHEELRNFSYIVSHDLKAPLRGIGSVAEWLSSDYKDKLDETGKEYLTLLTGRTNRLHHLIEGILEYSRIGKRNLEKTTVSSLKIVQGSVDLLLQQQNIDVTIDQNLPEVKFNEIQLTQIFQNIIGNSIKFIDKPSGKISVGFTELEKYFEFYVKDNGPGIRIEHHNKVFKIFQKLHARDDVESTGIGLSIVKKIVELSGGKIWIDSTIQEGACFKFTISK